MSINKKRASSATPKKPKTAAPPLPAFDVEMLLLIGEERLRFEREENDNVYFMADLIDPM
ncbi:hypothetical protein GTP46_20955 [Duganella sp. FT135W]|uniref:Uncharacterized protein n=1 Tax=Duganella flavida TaxID=2692175 RepID=A0A6L8KDK9_9BURK|nr:hypothetical protein [Duganella flavida]MYM25100.1 hypothetical protein [Duganella flavida]